MTQTSHELANFFVEASKALEELPHVKSKLSETEESLAICRDTNYGKDEQISHLRSDIDNLQQKLHWLEKDRDDAALEAMEAKEMAEKLIASIRDVMKGAAAVDAILNPTPEPSPETSKSTQAEPQLVEQSSVQDSQPSGQLLESSPSGSHTETAAVERPLDHSETTQTVHSTIIAESSDAVTAKPYATLEYWRKPDGITWKVWVDGGGEKAPWLHNTDLDHGQDIF